MSKFELIMESGRKSLVNSFPPLPHTEAFTTFSNSFKKCKIMRAGKEKTFRFLK